MRFSYFQFAYFRFAYIAWLFAAFVSALLATRPAAAHCIIGDRAFPMTQAIDLPCVTDDLMLMGMGTKNGDFTRENDMLVQASKRITETFGVTLASTWTRMWMPDNASVMLMPMEMPMEMDGMTMMHSMLMPMPMYMPGMAASGWQNLQTTFKYQLLTDTKAEFVLSAGLAVDWGGVGNRSVGAARFTTLTPTLWFGKGFGDFPERLGWARAFALTAQLGVRAPTWSRTLSVSAAGMPASGAEMSGMINSQMDMSCMAMSNMATVAMALAGMHMRSLNECRHPATLVYGASLQYDFSYLKDKLGIDLGLPGLLNRLTPLVEAQFRTPLAGTLTSSVPPAYGVELAPSFRAFDTATSAATTIGAVNPGLIWVGDLFQIGAEAIIPINRQSGRGVGWMVSIDFYLHRLFPDSIGRPLFGGGSDEHGSHDSHESHDSHRRDRPEQGPAHRPHERQAHGPGHAH